MYIKKRSLTVLCSLFFSLLSLSYAQKDLTEYELTLDKAVSKTLEHHQQLKISKAKIEFQEQQKEVAELQQLPSLTFSANAFYLGDALLLNTDFSKAGDVELPHFGNTFSVQASQLLYKGGAIRKSIELADMQTQLADYSNFSSNRCSLFKYTD